MCAFYDYLAYFISVALVLCNKTLSRKNLSNFVYRRQLMSFQGGDRKKFQGGSRFFITDNTRKKNSSTIFYLFTLPTKCAGAVVPLDDNDFLVPYRKKILKNKCT